MTSTYSALLSRDFQKKRKKWVDCRITIDNVANSVSVFELDESGTESGRKVYSGIVDSKTLLKLTGSEELKLGSVLVSLNDLISDSSAAVDISKQENLHSIAPVVALRPKALPFKIPSTSSRPSLSSTYAVVKPIPSQIITEEVGSSSNTRQAPLCSSADNVACTATSCASSLGAFSCPTTKISTRIGEDKLRNGVSSSNRTEIGMNSCINNVDMNMDRATPGKRSTTVQTLSLPRLYLQRNRHCKLDLVFQSPEQYARQFMDSLTEEIQLSISSAMCSLEMKALSAMNINLGMPAASTQLNMPGKGSSKLNVSQLLKKPLFAGAASHRPSPEVVIEKLRSAGIPLANRVEIIVSPPRNDNDGNSHEGASSKWGKEKGFKFSRGNSNNSSKRSNNDCASDEDSSRSNDVVTKSEEPSLEESTKLYFKIGDVRQRNCPQGAESYGKGDIWLLWRLESRVASAEEICSISKGGDSEMKSPRSLPIEGENLPLGINASNTAMETKRSAFVDMKNKHCYPLPWLGGILWQDVWVVRSLWHGVSDAGMMEFCNVDNTKAVPTGLGKFPPGRSRGTLEGSYSAIRMTHETTTLLSLDVLRGGVSKVNKVPALSDALSCDLLFRDLMFSTVFRRFLRPPKPFNHPLQRLQPAATCNSTVSEIDALIFPTVPRKFREKAVNKTVREFRLNSDQEKVLSLVSGWFAADSEGGEGMSSDVILVRGVFGSGKSHLLASVCVLLKRLSNIASAAGAATAASGGTGPSAQTSTLPSARMSGVKRPLGGTDRGRDRDPTATGRCSQVKCLLSANTNVAVDRVMVQLAERITSCSESNDKYSSVGAIDCSVEGEEEGEGDTQKNPLDRTQGEGSHVDDGNEFFASTPMIARVGCVAKIDRSLRKHFVLQAESRMSALREVQRLAKTDSDPLLLKLAEDTKKADFSNIQMKIIQDADVVGVTCASAGNVLMKDMKCHVLLLDEASQMTEPLSLLPMACAGPLRMLLVGDSKQLPPTMASTAVTVEVNGCRSGESDDNCDRKDMAVTGDLSRTLFDRLKAIGWPCIALRTQYRCHPTIAQICSDLFYEGHLLHGVSAADRPCIIPRMPPISAIDCTGEDQRRGESYVNQSEAVIARDLVIWLRNHASRRDPTQIPVENPSIGVICMYKAQAWLVSKLLADAGVEVRATSSASTSASDRVAGSGSHPASNSKSHLVNGSEMHYTTEESKSFDYDNDDDDDDGGGGGEGKIGGGRTAHTPQTGISNSSSNMDREISGVSHRSAHASELRVSTVDAFQGSEMDIIIICISKKTGSTFLSNAARVNVAVSRARHHLIVVGNGAVLRHLPLWSRVITDARLKVGTLQEFKRFLM